MTTVGIIPARYASTRLPGKPLAVIHGKPMIQHVYEQAIQALNHVCVATDDERIFKAVRAFDGRVVMTAVNHPSGTDRCAEAVVQFEKDYHLKADVIINIQGDEPFIDPEQIRQLNQLFEKEETQIATLVKPISDAKYLFNPNKVKVTLDKNGKALYFSRSCIPFVRGAAQEEWLDHGTFYHHIGMYGYRKSTLLELCRLEKSSLEVTESLEQLRWLEHGYSIHTAITHIEGLSVDTPEDLEAVVKKQM
ncbi:MAG: 3-deoxy-manno-octulosonate cytidylyltransferase [Bacteroidetes bacterium HGW-Bacteroidetes-4]|jgi:3-deoxy-manno-octulosonate cytidylyltransferase (CMP-KDO synthetase)|nr:MAG: 3-deoxy-manno-octulosonate cytidylyltransferase [Bacteroidetes bacterium HGW-Bacteroidetes-4]